VLVIHTTFGVEVRYSNYTDLEWSLRTTWLSAGGTCTEENIVIQKSLSSKQRHTLVEYRCFRLVVVCTIVVAWRVENNSFAGAKRARGPDVNPRVLSRFIQHDTRTVKMLLLLADDATDSFKSLFPVQFNCCLLSQYKVTSCL